MQLCIRIRTDRYGGIDTHTSPRRKVGLVLCMYVRIREETRKENRHESQCHSCVSLRTHFPLPPLYNRQ